MAWYDFFSKKNKPAESFDVDAYNKRFGYGSPKQSDQLTITPGAASGEGAYGTHGSLTPYSGNLNQPDLFRGPNLELNAPDTMPSIGLPKDGPVYGPPVPGAKPAAGASTGATAGASKGAGGSGGKNSTPGFTQTEIVAPNLLVPGTQPKKNFTFDPLNPTAEDYLAVFENDQNAEGFYSRMLGGVGAAQSGVIETRANQNLPSEDLQGARVAEGFENARGAWLDVQRKVSDFNRRVANIEQEVRADLGQEVTESAIQAEVNNRMKLMQPEYTRLSSELTNVKAYYDSTVDAMKMNFDARRADATEKVDRAAQILGFGKDNINMAYSMMTGLKNYDILVDAQKSEKRDAARAAVAVAMSQKGGLTRLSPQALANIEAQAELAPGTLAGIADIQKQGDFIYANIDDGGNFVWAQMRSNGSPVFGKQVDFAKVVPKSTSTASLTSWANSSESYRKIKAGVIDMILREGEGLDAAGRLKVIQKGSLILEAAANETHNDADQKNAQSFRASVLGGSTGAELTEDQINATFQALDAYRG